MLKAFVFPFSPPINGNLKEPLGDKAPPRSDFREIASNFLNCEHAKIAPAVQQVQQENEGEQETQQEEDLEDPFEDHPFLSLVPDSFNPNQKNALMALLAKAKDGASFLYMEGSIMPGERVSLSPEAVAFIGNSSINVDGRVADILLEGIPLNELPPISWEKDNEGRSFYQTIDVNSGIITVLSLDEDRQSVTGNILFLTDEKFVKERALRGFEIDLSPFLRSDEIEKIFGTELPRIRGLFRESSFRREGNIGPYMLFTSLEGKTLSEFRDKYFAVIEENLARVEKYFGEEAGTLVKRIDIVDSETANARGFPGGVQFYDEVLQHGPVITGRVALHEALHTVDLAFGISAQKSFMENWERLAGRKVGEWRFSEPGRRKESAFLEEICEKKFFEEGNFGGHAENDPGELFASLITSVVALNPDEWLDLLRKKSQEFICEYRNALEAAIEAMKSLKKPLANASIIEELSRRFEMLDEISGASN